MDFCIRVNYGDNNDQTEFAQFEDLISYIRQQLSQWNNFDSAVPMSIKLAKVRNGTPLIEIDVADIIDISEALSD